MPYGSGSAEPIICLLAQHALDRRAYRLLLAAELGCSVAVEGDFLPTSVWSALRGKPALVIAVVDAPPPQVVDVLAMVTRLCPTTRLLAITDASRPGQAEAWGNCPLHGCVDRGGSLDDLGYAVREMLDGREYYSASLVNAFSRGARSRGSTPRLSPRESELLPLLARGMTLRDAAAQMAVSYKTADSYRTSLLRKLGVHDRVQLARYAIREHIIDP